VSSAASFISLADTCVRSIGWWSERMSKKEKEREGFSDTKPAKFVLKAVGKG